jgi:hypothetical protein
MFGVAKSAILERPEASENSHLFSFVGQASPNAHTSGR